MYVCASYVVGTQSAFQQGDHAEVMNDIALIGSCNQQGNGDTEWAVSDLGVLTLEVVIRPGTPGWPYAVECRNDRIVRKAPLEGDTRINQ